MNFDCPECKARIRGPRPGAIVACRHCSNPVVVPEAPPPVVEAPPVLAEAEPPDVRRLWRTTAFVVAVLALAHVGLYLLLTMDARAGMNEIERVYTPAELRGARRPKAAPEPGTPAFAPWGRSVALWERAEAYRVHARQVTLLRIGLLLSFLILLGITAWVLIGLLRRAGGMARAEARRTETRTETVEGKRPSQSDAS